MKHEALRNRGFFMFVQLARKTFVPNVQFVQLTITLM
jgi:hypothetical protein